MCGIVGYTGKKKAAPILLDGLAKLEYRGYDSAGLAIRDGEANPVVVKAKGRLKVLSEKTDAGSALKGTCGIGHTRWATHGEPTENNAHPHIVDDYNVVGVHNGIIENYQELRDKMIRKGYKFYSETDTEVAIKTIDYYYKKYTHDPIEALAKTMVRVRGSYALAVMFKDHPGKIFVARKDSPMIIGCDKDASYLASDVPAILKYTRSVYYINDLEMACLEPGGVTFYNLDGDTIEKTPTEIDWDAASAEKGGFEHFMMKEIHEQPKAVQDTLNSVIVPDGDSYRIDLSATNLTDEDLKSFEQIYIVACGSAYHVGCCTQYIVEQLAGIPVRCELASEFRYRTMPLNKNALCIIISQSGETADSLAALRDAKNNGIKVGCASSSIKSYVYSLLSHLKIDGYFEAVCGGDDAIAPKPAPDPYLAVCKKLGVEPKDAIAFEDSYLGTLSAKNASISCVGYREHTKNTDFSECFLVIERMDDIIKIWQ